MASYGSLRHDNNQNLRIARLLWPSKTVERGEGKKEKNVQAPPGSKGGFSLNSKPPESPGKGGGEGGSGDVGGASP